MTSPLTSSTRRGRPGGLAGRDLLDAARSLFLAEGYAATTMDAVATAARISKQTLYRSHASKDDLLAAVVRDWVDRGRDAMRPHLDRLLQADDLEAGLLDFAAVLQAGVLGPGVVAIRALVISVADRLPDLAADYVRRSWDRNITALASALRELDRRGSLSVDEPDVAAQQLTWLVLGAALDRLTLTGGAVRLPEAELDSIRHEAVATFLARYRAPVESQNA